MSDKKDQFLSKKLAQYKYRQSDNYKEYRKSYYQKNKWRFTRYYCTVCKKLYYPSNMDTVSGLCLDCANLVIE
jgi:hypothetical protein